MYFSSKVKRSLTSRFLFQTPFLTLVKMILMQQKLLNLIYFLFVLNSSFAQEILKDFETPFSAYPVKAGACADIMHTSGSEIFIEEGSIPAGLDSVIIYYREMHTPMDMIVHDIRMYTWLGEKIYLESSGMFEIYALAGNDTIEMAPGKTIEVRMATTPQKADPMVEGYIYNQTQQHWENYTNQINILKIDEDNHLWGSPPVKNNQAVNNGGNPQETEDTWAGSVDFSIQSPQVLQTMSINQFGLFNFDKMLGGFNYVYLQPSFVVDSNEAISSTIYLVYKNINSVFYFPANSNDEFFIIKNQPYMLFTISDEGNVLLLKNYPKLSNTTNQKVTFELQDMGKAKTRRELSKLIGLQ